VGEERVFIIVAGYRSGSYPRKAAATIYKLGFSKAYMALSGDVHAIGWHASMEAEDLLELRERALEEGLEERYWWPGVYKESPYARGYKASEILDLITRAEGLPWLIAYPMKKSPEWYLIPLEERRRIMGEHIRIARESSSLAGSVRSYTTYAFGLASYEFLVIYEVSDIAGWIDVVEKLRLAEARKWVIMEEPVLAGKLVPAPNHSNSK